MIITVEGKIGSGKTYWAVHYLVERWFVWNDDCFGYIPKGNVRIITNISDLTLPHIDLDSEVERLGGLEKVFTENYEGMTDPHIQTIILLDEAQAPRYFHRKYYNPTVFLFFQKSRHIGVDIILITQDKWTLCKEVQVLSEYNVVSIARSVRAKNVFMYKYMYGNEVGRRKAIVFSKRIASLYKSFEKLEGEKVNYLWKKYLVAIAACVVLVLVGFKVGIAMFFGAKDKPPAVAGGQSKGGVRPTASTPTAAGVYDDYKSYQEQQALEVGGVVPETKSPSVKAYGVPAVASPNTPVVNQVPAGSSSTGVVVPGTKEDRHEPLVAMKCEVPDERGWQECFEGHKYVGRFKARVSSTLPEYSKK